MPDLPVAAPDPASVIEHFLTLRSPAFMDELPRWSDAKKEARAALVALRVERQQDKERIERLEAAVSRYEIHLGIARSFIPAARNQTYLARVDEALDRRAALAVEEDAPKDQRFPPLEACDCGSAQEDHGWACRCDNPPSKRAAVEEDATP